MANRGAPLRVEDAVQALVTGFRLDAELTGRLLSVVECVAHDPHAPTSVRDPLSIVEQHLADSLVALELESLSRPFVGLDLGSGAGFPGLPLALASPQSSFVLLDSARRKGEFMHRVATAAGAANVEVVSARAEAWPDGRERFDVVTARAVGPLDVVIEYAAPLLRVGGVLVAWRGRRDPDAEGAAERAAAALGMRVSEIRAVKPFPRAQSRHLHVISKEVETPIGFPRRPGVAARKPLGAGF